MITIGKFRALAVGASTVLAASAVLAGTVAITDGTIYTLGPAGVIEHGTVLIEEGKIKAVGTAVKVPPGARLIAAGGHIVTPGLMNSYTDLGLDEVIENAGQTLDRHPQKGTTAASFDVRYGLNANSSAIAVARIEGLTRAIAAPDISNRVFAGSGAEIQLGEGGDILVTPRIAMFVDLGVHAREAVGGSRSGAWAQLLSDLSEARDYDRNRAGYEHGAHAPYVLPREELEALVPVVRGELPLAILANRESDIRNLIRFKVEQHVKVILIGAAEAWRVGAELAAAKIPVILNPVEDLPWNFDELGMTLSNAARLSKAGVLIALRGSWGFDEGPYNVGNISTLAGIAAANGLSRDEALAAITINPARIWGIDSHYGTLEPGKDADIVVWDGDPLEPSSAPLALLIRGAEIPLTSRQTQLRDRYMRATEQHVPPAYLK